MKVQPMIVVGLLGALVCGTAFSQQGGGKDDLEARVAAQEQRIDELARELSETRALLDEAVTYQKARSKAAQAMLPVFQTAEDKGYTAGINYESREVLLAGWRKFMADAGKGLPGSPEPDDPEPADAQPVQR
jgi:hypothetical protein